MQIVDDQILVFVNAVALQALQRSARCSLRLRFCGLFIWAIYEVGGELDKAILYINEALEHTPTATVCSKKARVLKKMGQLKSAALVATEGRALDLPRSLFE